VDAVASDDAVGGPFVFDLEHHALVGLVDTVEGFGDDAVQAGAFELLEPLLRQTMVGGGGRDRWGER